MEVAVTAEDWKDYQEEAASFFRSLGLDAETDVRIEGVRTKHDIDVVVKSSYVGFEVLWLVECKHWKTSVCKLHVLGLRQIVTDVGADRGILLCEVGAQTGSVEAANLTNVRITSLAELVEPTTEAVNSMRIRDLYDRIESCRTRYWDIPKDQRINHGLRAEVYVRGYSGADTIRTSIEILSRAMRGVYPFQCDEVAAFLQFGKDHEFKSSTHVIESLEPMVRELEHRLEKYEMTLDNA